MLRSVLRTLPTYSIQAVLLASLAIPVLSACEVRGIGDPCTPEAIPAGGFDAREVYVETSSVQCRTRTCMVFRLRGNPECVRSADPARNTCTTGPECSVTTMEGTQSTCVDGDTDSVLDATSLQRVFCSCRCSAAGDVNTPLCACTEGFHCVDVLTAGGVGVQGGYCVPNDLCTTDDDCPGGTPGSCNEGVCG